MRRVGRRLTAAQRLRPAARTLFAGTVLAGLVFGVVPTHDLPAYADTDPSGSTVDQVSEFSDPEVVCEVTDERVADISGAVTIDKGILLTNDQQASLVRIDDACQVTAVQILTDVPAKDVEDLVRDDQGTIWLVDSGGNKAPRGSVDLWGRRNDGSVVRARFDYPSGRYDAEAAVITPEDELLLFTKEQGRTKLFTAPMPEDYAKPVELEQAGEIDMSSLSDAGSTAATLVTGAAISPDGEHLAVLTYDGAYEWTLGAGGWADTVTGKRPVSVGGLDQKQGEAITYTADGGALLAFSELLPSPVLRIDITRSAPPEFVPEGSVPNWVYALIAVPLVLLLIGLLGLRSRVRAGRRDASAGSQGPARSLPAETRPARVSATVPASESVDDEPADRPVEGADGSAPSVTERNEQRPKGARPTSKKPGAGSAQRGRPKNTVPKKAATRSPVASTQTPEPEVHRSTMFRVGQWLGRGPVLAALAAWLLVALAGVGLSTRVAIDYESVVVVAFEPRDAAISGAETMVLVTPRYTEVLRSPEVIDQVAEELGREPDEIRRITSGSIQPNTLNLEISVRTDDPKLAAQAADALAASVVRVAASDELLSAFQVSAAVEADAPDQPTPRTVALAGAILGPMFGLGLGLVLALRRRSIRPALGERPGPEPTSRPQ